MKKFIYLLFSFTILSCSNASNQLDQQLLECQKHYEKYDLILIKAEAKSKVSIKNPSSFKMLRCSITEKWGQDENDTTENAPIVMVVDVIDSAGAQLKDTTMVKMYEEFVLKNTKLGLKPIEYIVILEFNGHNSYGGRVDAKSISKYDIKGNETYFYISE